MNVINAVLRNLFFFFPVLRGLWDLSSHTKDWTQIMAVKAWSSNHQGTLKNFLKNIVAHMSSLKKKKKHHKIKL